MGLVNVRHGLPRQPHGALALLGPLTLAALAVLAVLAAVLVLGEQPAAGETIIVERKRVG